MIAVTQIGMQSIIPTQMTPSPQKKKSDRRQIDIHNEWEIQYWSQRFGCSSDQLVNAVNKVGRSPVKVVRELERQVENLVLRAESKQR